MIELSNVRMRAASRCRGFSLAEVLVAVALMAVILLALFGLVNAGVKRAYSGKKMTEASIIAQHVMQRINVYSAHTTLGALDTDTTITKTWTRTGNADTNTTPVAESGGSTAEIERNAIRSLLATADIPATTMRPATLTVTSTGVTKSGTSSFATAPMERIVVNLTWYEWGTRQRQVQLQALNLKTTP